MLAYKGMAMRLSIPLVVLLALSFFNEVRGTLPLDADFET
jgi:hypothetical protein